MFTQHTPHRWHIIESPQWVVFSSQNSKYCSCTLTQYYGQNQFNFMFKQTGNHLHSRSLVSFQELFSGALCYSYNFSPSSHFNLRTNEQSFVTSQKCFRNEQNDAGHLICMLCSNFVACDLPAMLVCACATAAVSHSSMGCCCCYTLVWSCLICVHRQHTIIR